MCLKVLQIVEKTFILLKWITLEKIDSYTYRNQLITMNSNKETEKKEDYHMSGKHLSQYLNLKKKVYCIIHKILIYLLTILWPLRKSVGHLWSSDHLSPLSFPVLLCSLGCYQVHARIHECCPPILFVVCLRLPLTTPCKMVFAMQVEQDMCLYQLIFRFWWKWRSRLESNCPLYCILDHFIYYLV